MKSVVMIVFILIGCEKTQAPLPVTDLCMQREIFESCLSKTAAGIISTVNNDLDDVVYQCRVAAEQMAKRDSGHVKPECRK